MRTEAARLDQQIARQLALPAACLLASGVLMLIAALVMLAFWTVPALQWVWRTWFPGTRDSAFVPLIATQTIIVPLISALMIVTSVLIKQARGYRLAVMSSILAMLPWGLAWPPCLVCGIVAISVLGRPHISEAFAEHRANLIARRQMRVVALSAPHVNLSAQAARSLRAVAVAMMLFCMVIVTVGFGLATAPLWLDSMNRDQVWGVLGGATGCIIGGLGGIVGSWNTYRQTEGAPDLLHEPHWTWLDRTMLIYGLLGAVGIVVAYMSDGWTTAAHAGMVMGGIVLFQAILYPLIRIPLARAARAQ